MSSSFERQVSKAVLIGAGEFEHDELEPLPAAGRNVDDLLGLLTSPGGLFPPEHCVAVHDPGRPSQVGDAVGSVASEATSVLLVYYTGHGMIDRRGRLHLAVARSDPDRIRWTAVPFETLREEILDSDAQSRILILDCCFAGRAFEALSDLPSLVAGQTEIRGTYTIASCSANEPSFAPSGHRNTAFTAALLSAASPGVTLDELYRQTDRRLRREGYPRPRRRHIDVVGELQLFGPPLDDQENQHGTENADLPEGLARLLARRDNAEDKAAPRRFGGVDAWLEVVTTCSVDQVATVIYSQGKQESAYLTLPMRMAVKSGSGRIDWCQIPVAESEGEGKPVLAVAAQYVVRSQNIVAWALEIYVKDLGSHREVKLHITGWRVDAWPARRLAERIRDAL